MRAALRFIIIAAILLGLAWWVGNLPGDVTAHSGRYTVQTSVPAALLLLFIIAVVFTALLRLGGGVRRAPGGFFAWRGGRRRRLGESALHRGLVALAAGDAPAAQAEARRTRKLLGDTPLALLLTAEAARLAGDTAQSRAAFQQLTADKTTAFLGHRGLLRHSLADGAHDAAAGHAAAAQAAYPRSAWLATQKLDLAVRQQNWPAALALTREPAAIAAFATAAASAEPGKQSIGYGKQAVKADPALAPGIVAYAAALFAAGKPRAAKKTLRAGWAKAPHPLIADAWLGQAASPIERAQSAAALASANPTHPESAILLAQTALQAQLPGEARRHANTVPTDDRATAILATLDGKQGLALTTPKWTCNACNAPTTAWAPVCPNCQKPGSLIWTPS